MKDRKLLNVGTLFRFPLSQMTTAEWTGSMVVSDRMIVISFDGKPLRLRASEARTYPLTALIQRSQSAKHNLSRFDGVERMMPRPILVLCESFP